MRDNGTEYHCSSGRVNVLGHGGGAGGDDNWGREDDISKDGRDIAKVIVSLGMMILALVRDQIMKCLKF